MFARRTLLTQVGTKLDAVLADGSPARRESERRSRNSNSSLGRSAANSWSNGSPTPGSTGFVHAVHGRQPLHAHRHPVAGARAVSAGGLGRGQGGAHRPGHGAEAIRRKVSDLLDGSVPCEDPQGEAYRLLLVGACNSYRQVMPFLFEKIEDYTELLLPVDLLSGNSVLADLRKALPANVRPKRRRERRSDRLAVSVLHFGEKGRGL